MEGDRVRDEMEISAAGYSCASGESLRAGDRRLPRGAKPRMRAVYVPTVTTPRQPGNIALRGARRLPVASKRSYARRHESLPWPYD